MSPYSERSVRVLLVTPVLGGADYFGGIPATVARYAEVLAKHGAEVDIVAGIRIFGLFREGSRWSKLRWRIATKIGWCTGREIMKAFRGVRWADVVIVHGWFHVLARLVSRAAVEAGKPWMLVPHGTLMAQARGHSPFKKSVELFIGGERLLQSCRAVLVASDEEAQSSVPYISPRIIMAPPPVLVSPLYENGTRGTGRTLRIGFLGRFNSIKRLDLMLEACRLGRGTDAEFRLMLAGSDEQGLARLLTDRYQDLFAAGLACWVTPLDGQAKDAFLAELDALILISSFESYGVVILEAWAQGTPCIVAPTVGLASVVRERGGGVVLDEASVPAILRGVRQLKVALQGRLVDRSVLRALAVEFGEQLPTHGILKSLDICGMPLNQSA